MNDARPRVGFIVGPTGTGKSALAVEVAESLDAEIVNADSRLLYRGLEIGTAKPSLDLRRRVPHHVMDLRPPGQPLDVAQFRAAAGAAIAEILSRGKAVIVTGGSGLYIKVLRHGIFAGPPASPGLRRELTQLASSHGVDYLHRMLREVDPESAGRLGARDLHRVVRALEVIRLTGIPISRHQRDHNFGESRYHALTVGLCLPRERLYQAIDRRFDAMIAAGLVDEVRTLIAAGLSLDTSIGYKHIAAHLRGELNLQHAIALAKRDTRRLAKRQLTWLRSDPEIIWLEADSTAEHALKLFRSFFNGTSRPIPGAEPLVSASLPEPQPAEESQD